MAKKMAAAVQISTRSRSCRMGMGRRRAGSDPRPDADGAAVLLRATKSYSESRAISCSWFAVARRTQPADRLGHQPP